MANVPDTFRYIITDTFPALLHELKIGLAVSTYQASRVLFLSAPKPDKLIQIPRLFKRAMGLAVDGHRLAIASLYQVEVLANHPQLAGRYPNNPRVFDALYLPRATYYSGYTDLHDIAWDRDGNLWGVNTAFSCLIHIGNHYSFEPQWHPPFITELMPEDRCHLNGMAMVEGMPRYVTLLGQYNVKEGWRADRLGGGMVMDITTNEVIADGLAMPHSPRWHQGKLYVLLSGTGELAEIDVQNKKTKVIADLRGFGRGMAAYGDYLFIGMSKIRESAKSFQELPVTPKATHARVVVYQISTGQEVAELEYQNTAEELFEVAVIPDTHRLNAVGPHQEICHRAVAAPPNLYFWRKESKKEKDQKAREQEQPQKGSDGA